MILYKKILVLLLVIILMTGCNKQTQIKDEVNKSNNIEVNSSMKIEINDQEYEIDLEQNKTVAELIKLLPLELTMNELNGNEKYIFMDKSLPTDEFYPKKINKGDFYLYEGNCLVIFYESFDTTFSYTKIGHINNLPDLGNGSITVKLK